MYNAILNSQAEADQYDIDLSNKRIVKKAEAIKPADK